jgi:periplasmic protein TonB
MSVKKEDKDKRIGWLVSISVHALIILLFFFILAWQAPDPPLPEYGIELNLGIEEDGSGFEQPTATPTVPVEEEQGEPEQQVEEITEEIIEEPEEAEVNEVPTVEELPDSQQEDSPVEAKPAEVKETPLPVEKEVEEKPVPVTKPVEEPKEEPKPEEKKVDANALYPGSSSQGKSDNKAGDAGSKEGTVDSRALYGKSGGGGGGPSLDLAGWRWDSEPKPNDNSKENGRIVFEIKVDDSGVVIGVRTLEKTVSPTVEQLYRREVEKLTFSPLSGNTIPAPISTGKITFIISSQ